MATVQLFKKFLNFLLFMSATQKRVRLSYKWHNKVHLSANCLKASYNEVFQWVCMKSWLSPRGLRSLALKKKKKKKKQEIKLYLDLNGVPYVGSLLIKVKNYFLYPPNDITNKHPFRDRQWLITWQGLMHCKIYNSL